MSVKHVRRRPPGIFCPLSGLAPEEAAKRPSQYGANELAQQEKASPWAFFKRNAGLRVTIKGIL